MWLRPISPETAATLNELMQGVVTDGTASCCLGISRHPDRRQDRAPPSSTTAGQPEESHAWIIAFAPADNPQYAVAVMLEAQPEVSASTGGRLAGPIAQRMLETAFGRMNAVPRASGCSPAPERGSTCAHLPTDRRRLPSVSSTHVLRPL